MALASVALANLPEAVEQLVADGRSAPDKKILPSLYREGWSDEVVIVSRE